MNLGLVSVLKLEIVNCGTLVSRQPGQGFPDNVTMNTFLKFCLYTPIFPSYLISRLCTKSDYLNIKPLTKGLT